MPPPKSMYCAEQINVPPELPDILKQFTKAAIRTQPPDVLSWSAAYFSALAKGETLPVKRRLEPGATGLTIGLLDVLYQQLQENTMVSTELLSQKWKELGLPSEQLQEIMSVGNFVEEFEFMKFFAVACSHLGGKNVTQAMRIVCQILTKDPDGSAYRIPFETFTTLFKYLASLNREISQAQVEAVLSHLQEDVSPLSATHPILYELATVVVYAEARRDKQGGMVMPRNFLSAECPSLT